MNKEQYRQYFKKIQKYVKFSAIMEALKIPRTNFSLFMSGNDSVLSVDRLEMIKKQTKSILMKSIKE